VIFAKSIFLFVVFSICSAVSVFILAIGGPILISVYCAALAVWCYAEFKMMHLHKDLRR